MTHQTTSDLKQLERVFTELREVLCLDTVDTVNKWQEVRTSNPMIYSYVQWLLHSNQLYPICCSLSR